MNIVYEPIGIIHTAMKEREGTPIQSAFGSEHRGHVELYEQYVEGLSDLDGFSHAYLLYHFHKSSGFSLKVRPFMDEVERGVFATRAPRRPNPIGLSIVTILGIEGNIINFSGVDILDGTPLLDIKPYIGDFDTRGEIRSGWTESAIKNNRRRHADDRFSE